MEWLKKNWGSLVFFIVGGAVLIGALWWAIMAFRDHRALVDLCISEGYAGLVSVDGLQRYVCYSTLSEGRGTFVDVATLREEARK